MPSVLQDTGQPPTPQPEMLGLSPEKHSTPLQTHVALVSLTMTMPPCSSVKNLNSGPSEEPA